MSVITSQPLNGDQIQANLPQGASFYAIGGLLGSSDAKTLYPVGTDDATLQTAVNAAASQYVDYTAQLGVLLQKAPIALQNNISYLGLGTPTTAQVVAQVAALTRQMDALIRVVVGLLSSSAGT